jgi:hypothetical protein
VVEGARDRSPGIGAGVAGGGRESGQGVTSGDSGTWVLGEW